MPRICHFLVTKARIAHETAAIHEVFGGESGSMARIFRFGFIDYRAADLSPVNRRHLKWRSSRTAADNPSDTRADDSVIGGKMTLDQFGTATDLEIANRFQCALGPEGVPSRQKTARNASNTGSAIRQCPSIGTVRSLLGRDDAFHEVPGTLS
jgi:hypothetical protein